MREMPAISASTYASNAVDWETLNTPGWLGNAVPEDTQKLFRAAARAEVARRPILQGNLQNLTHEETEPMATRRLVQVFIADPNENVPLEEALIYKGEQKFTDGTDQELFFEIDINALLKAYNEKRVKFIDKKVKERTEYLEPIKIRELKMVVVTVAQF